MKLSEMQKDALREICSIGSGHAASALSQLIGRKVLIEVPRVEILPLEKVPEVLGGAEKVMVAVYDRVLGEVRGGILFMMPFKSAKRLSLIMKHEIKREKSIDEEACEILKRIGSIVSSAYLSALGRFVGVSLIPVDASISFDMAGGVIETVVVELGLVSDYALLVDTPFRDEKRAIESYLLFIPDPNSLEVILEKIGLKK